MGTQLSKFFAGYQQPSREKQTEALAALSAGKAALMGKAFLRLLKSGKWVFGADSEVLAVGTVLIVNPASFQTGYIAWFKGGVENEIMQPLAMGPVDPSRLTPVESGTAEGRAKCKNPTQGGRGWEAQVSVDLLTDEDTPVQLQYKTNSLGGKKALLELSGEIGLGLNEDPRRAYPLIELQVDSYQHKEYGEVFVPLFPVVGWLDAEGNEVVDRPKLV